MYPFIYHRPTNLAEAKRLFRTATDASFLSGGHTLLPALKQRLAAPSDLVDLWGMAELQGVALSGDRLTIGGGMVHAAVAASEIVRAHIPVLASLAGSIGDRHVRHRGTIGGSVANNDPAADYPSAVLALDGTILTDRRRIAADDYFSGLYETAREPDEIVTAIEFPVPLSAGYAKFRNAASRYALAAVFVARTISGVRLAVTGAGASGVFRPAAFEAALNADFRPEALDDVTIDPDSLLSDTAATAAYRANLVKVLARRAVARQGVVQIFK
jgi:carbon-monoxide dehydrogenase medium subunit